MKTRHWLLLSTLLIVKCACNITSENRIDDNLQDPDVAIYQQYADLEQQKPDSHNVSQYNNLILEYTNDIALKSYQLDSIIQLLQEARMTGDDYRTYLSHVAHYLGNSGRIDSAVKTLRRLYFSVPSETWSQSYIDYHWNLEMTLLKIKDSDCDSAKYFGKVLSHTIRKDSNTIRLEEIKTAENILVLLYSECPK